MPEARAQLASLIDKIKQEEVRVDQIQAADAATRSRLTDIKRKLVARRLLLEQDLELRDEYYESSVRLPVSELEKRSPQRALIKATGDDKKEIRRRIKLRKSIAELRKQHPILYKKRKVGGEPDYAGYACIQKCDTGIRRIQERNIREQVVAGMKELNNAECGGGGARFDYPHNSDDREFKMPISSWQRRVRDSSDYNKPDQSKSMDFETRLGVRPSDAITAVFSGPECPIYIECLTAMYLLYFRAILKNRGPGRI